MPQQLFQRGGSTLTSIKSYVRLVYVRSAALYNNNDEWKCCTHDMYFSKKRAGSKGAPTVIKCETSLLTRSGKCHNTGSIVLRKKLVLLHRKLLQKDATQQSTNKDNLRQSLRDEFETKSGTNLDQCTPQSILTTYLNKYNYHCNI